MSFSATEMRALEIHSQVREGQELQKLMLNLSTNCFNDCSKDFLSGKVSDQERECIRNCSQKFWAFFNRSQSIAQENMKAQMALMIGSGAPSAAPASPPK